MIKGVRKKSKHCLFDDKLFHKAERKFGEFTLNFKIPEEYERKWYYCEISNGIMCLKYRKDTGESGDEMEEGEIESKVDANVK